MSSAWQPGIYEGTVRGGQAIESSSKGTPGFEVTFDVGGHDIKIPFWLSDAAWEGSMAGLARLGFNNDFTKPAFSVPGPHQLELTHEDYKGRPQPKWNLARRQAAALAPDKLAQLTARAKATASAPPPRPMGAPPAPPKPPAASSAPKAPPPAKETEKYEPCTREDAWHTACNEEADEAKRLSLWNKCVAHVQKSSGKPESQFDESDWGNVSFHLTLPF